MSQQNKAFQSEVDSQVARRVKARRRRRGPWFGLAVFGMVGWSVVVPLLLGVWAGNWLDRTFPSQASWTITLMGLGLVAGCFNAWRWVSKESHNGD